MLCCPVQETSRRRGSCSSIVNVASAHLYQTDHHRRSGAAAAAISLLIGCAPVSVGSLSKRLRQNCGGSRGRRPLWREGYTSEKKYQTVFAISQDARTNCRGCHSDSPCPTMTPHISSFGTVPCSTRLKAINTHGRYGAVKTSSPKNESLVSGFRRLHMYTSVELSAEPRKGMESSGERQRSDAVA